MLILCILDLVLYVDLLDMAAVETVRNGGEVYVLDGDEMPDSTSTANAIFRYEM